MKLFYMFIMGFLFFMPIALSEDFIVTTTISQDMIAYLDNSTSTCKANVTTHTNNSDGPSNFVMNGYSEYSNVFFDIRFIKNIECNKTAIDVMINTCNSYFTECDALPCKQQWNDCKTGKDIVVEGKNTCETSLSEMTTLKLGLEGNLTQCNNEKTKQGADKIICDSNYNTCKTNLDKKNSTIYLVGIIGLLVGSGGMWFFKIRPKQGTKTEIERTYNREPTKKVILPDNNYFDVFKGDK